jgi:hypothetical protein
LCDGILGNLGNTRAVVLAVVETPTTMVPLVELDMVRLFGLTVQVAACGAPAQVKLTVPLKPEAVNE